jgi:hypothetical protein
VERSASSTNSGAANSSGVRVAKASPRQMPANKGRAAPSANSKYRHVSTAATTCAANHTVPCTLLKKYTLPKQNKQDSATFSSSPRFESPRWRSFSSKRNNAAGASPARSKKNSPSHTACALPDSATSGTSTTLGKGGKTTNHLPSNSAKSLFCA